MNHKGFLNSICLAGMLLLVGMIEPVTVYAAEADVYFGSNWYEPDNEGAFNVGVYLESEDVIGAYEVVLSYDERYYSYVGGANSGGDGLVILSGDLQGQSIRYMLEFEAISGGESTIKVESASLLTADGTEQMDISTLPEESVRIALSETALVTGLSINGVPVSDLNSEALTGSVEIPYAEELSISTEDDVTTELIYDELVTGASEIGLRVTAADGSSNLYLIAVRMAEPEETAEPVETETDAESMTQTEDSEEMTESADSEPVQSEEAPGVAQTQVSNERHNRMVPALLDLAVILILALVFFGRNIVHKRKQRQDEMLEKIQKIRDENSDFNFSPLYDEEEQGTDGK